MFGLFLFLTRKLKLKRAKIRETRGKKVDLGKKWEPDKQVVPEAVQTGRGQLAEGVHTEWTACWLHVLQRSEDPFSTVAAKLVNVTPTAGSCSADSSGTRKPLSQGQSGEAPSALVLPLPRVPVFRTHTISHPSKSRFHT